MRLSQSPVGKVRRCILCLVNRHLTKGRFPKKIKNFAISLRFSIRHQKKSSKNEHGRGRGSMFEPFKEIFVVAIDFLHILDLPSSSCNGLLDQTPAGVCGDTVAKRDHR